MRLVSNFFIIVSAITRSFDSIRMTCKKTVIFGAYLENCKKISIFAPGKFCVSGYEIQTDCFFLAPGDLCDVLRIGSLVLPHTPVGQW